LIKLNVVPIVNENDTVATEELKFGDNDTLSAQVASLVGADWLFLLTDVDRLYSADPRFHPDAHPIELVKSLDQLQQLQIDVGKPGSQWGTGGMVTKITAAKIATEAGIRTVITDGQQPPNLLPILAGESIGTQFEPQHRPVNARKRWIAHGSILAGQLYLDDGAVRAITQAGKSLLAVGIVECEGEFQRQDAVALCDRQGHEVGRGIVNYDSQTLQQILGQKPAAIARLLELPNPEAVSEVIHRDNLVLTIPSS
jgi:glutamate 5-kinase